MKSSNKYLFDQSVDCDYCKHVIYEGTYARCKLNPFKITGHLKYRVTVVARNEDFKDDLSNYCGPLGLLYEPIK